MNLKTKFDEVKGKIESETGVGAWRSQQVPCAFCKRGGNGDGSCGCGFFERLYSPKGCFSGELLDHNPLGE